MFTGIIQKVVPIGRFEKSADSLRILVSTGWNDVVLGESIAVNGACLTVTEQPSSGDLDFFISQETLDRTNLKSLESNSRVNLERALLASDRLSGHVVQGHVDGEAKFISATSVGESFDVRFEIPASLARYCVEKGSITLNGVSLTLNEIETLPSKAIRIGIMLIPHTWAHTNLSSLQPEALVNVEVDVLAKYMEKLCQPYFKQLTI